MGSARMVNRLAGGIMAKAGVFATSNRGVAVNFLPLRLGVLLAVVGLCATAFAALLVQHPPADPPATLPNNLSVAPAPGVKAGCAGAACHGADADLKLPPGKDCWPEAVSRFQAADPHTRAFDVLKTAEAKQIVNGIGGTDATKDMRCLACHTTPQYAGDTARAAVGIGCAGCHGEADKWLRPHTGWRKNPDTRPDDYRHGPNALHDIRARAKVCAGCHVGAPASPGVPVRDMNHDMIAAGHPRLFFDLAELQRRLPKHWYETLPESALWMVGRVAHAEAACELLADRATRKAPWPEFAEGNCASCHHAIQANDPPKGGAVRWQALWPLNDAPALKSLHATMSVKGTPDAEKVQKLAATAAGQLKALQMPNVEFPKSTDALDPDEILQLLHGLAAQERDRPAGKAAEFKSVFDLFREPTVPPPDIPKVREKANGLLPK